MKPFKFSLQALLVLREQEEQDALQTYGKTLMARERAISALRSAEEELSGAWFHMSEKLGTNCNSMELTHLQNYCQAMEWRVKECELAANQAREQTEHAFMELLSARQARAVLEKYLEREKQRYLRDKRRREQRQIDDLPSRRGGLAEFFEESEPAVWN